MALLDIQRRHATLFRVRMGDLVEYVDQKTKKTKTRPRKLTDSIRVTSPNIDIVRAFTETYGGEVQPWPERKQFQAYLPTTFLRIWLLPGAGIEQWWERYRGSVCDRRCDGFTETKSRKPCMCPADIEQRVAERDSKGSPLNCQPTTRINILCPDVAVAGSGALITRGLIAAETIPQAVAVAEGALRLGHWVPAILRVVEHRGRNHFIVPQIEIAGVSPAALLSGEANLPTALDAPPARAALPAGPPPPETQPYELPPAPQSVGQTRSIADQMGGVEQEPVASTRKNRAEPIRPTGVAPRTLDQASSASDDVPPEDEESAGPMPAPQRIAMLCREHGIDRAHLAHAISEGRTESTRELDAGEHQLAFHAIEMLRSSAWVLKPSGGRWLLESTGVETSPDSASSTSSEEPKPEPAKAGPLPAGEGTVIPAGFRSAGKRLEDLGDNVIKGWAQREVTEGIEQHDEVVRLKQAATIELARREQAKAKDDF